MVSQIFCHECRGVEDKYVCEICRDPDRAEELLYCDGCDKLFHTFCLTPPLTAVPEGDWFCDECKGYNSDVSSVVEIEPVGDFSIEQYKHPGKVKDFDQNNDFAVIVKKKENTCQSKSSTYNVMDKIHIRPDALSLTGFVNRLVDLEDRRILWGIFPRKGSSDLPIFAYPCVKCLKCNGHYPTHMLTKIFMPPINIPKIVGEFKECKDNLIPPMPWLCCNGFTYVCGHCSVDKKYRLYGNLTFHEGWSMPWMDAILITFVNLLLLTNPTEKSNMIPPPMFSSENKSSFGSNDKQHRTVYFTLSQIMHWIDYHWIYLSRYEASSVPWRVNLGQSLDSLVKDKLIKEKESDGLKQFTLVSKGFQRMREYT